MTEATQTQTQTHYIFAHDAGHGWLAVSPAELKRLGIADKISHYSYVARRDDVVWLEEDCDATTFHLAKEAAGEKYQTLEIYHGNDSPIRELPSYQA
jgi:hypothetical protein